MKTLNSINWIHRDERKPEEGQDIVISTSDPWVLEGTYAPRHRAVDCTDIMVNWDEVIGWLPKEQFPYSKEEDFE